MVNSIVSISQQDNYLKVFSSNDQQLVLQIPSNDNHCELPTLLVCTPNSDSSDDCELLMTTLDDLMTQVKLTYGNDAEALQRFSYYLVLKAKEMST